LPRGAPIGGQITGPISSYQKLRNGYWNFSESGGILSFITEKHPIPGLVSIFVRTTGPDQFLVTSGYNVSTVLPSLIDFPLSSSTQFLSEDMVHAPNFENLTGGPQIQKGAWWDWFQSGAVPQTSATGVDDLARQKAENRAFDAAVAFGLSAAALAAFAVEVVGAISEAKKRRSDKSGSVAAEPG
jgi:hypothetical protein